MTTDAPAPPDGGLGERAARGFVWSAVQSWGTKLTTTAVFIVLARLLGPEDFGLVAIATTVITFVQLFQEQGFGQALIQRRDLEPEHLDAALWFGLGVGSALCLLLQVLAGPIAGLYGEPQVEDVIRWLALSFVVGGVSTTPQALLRRNLRFRPLAVRQLSASAAGGVVGISAAVSGAGLWALVAQQLTTTLVAAIALWASTTWRPRWRFSRRHLGDLAGFGSRVLSTNIATYANKHADDLLIGAFLGPVALGLYTVAYRILTVMGELFTRTITQVSLPMFARLGGDQARMRRALGSATRMASLAAFPAFLGVAALAPELTAVAFGEQWAASVPVMRVLALVGAIRAVTAFNSNVMLALGRPGLEAIINWSGAIVNVIAFAIGLRWGILGVATAFAIRTYAMSPITLVLLRRLIDLDVGAWLLDLARPLLGAGVMVAAILGVTGRLDPATPDAVVLAVGVLVGAAAYAAVVAVVARPLSREALGYVRMALPRTSR